MLEGALIMVVVSAGQGLAAGTASMPGDARRSAKIFRQCAVCHKFDPHAHNYVGPVLNGAVGPRAATYPGYTYCVYRKPHQQASSEGIG